MIAITVTRDFFTVDGKLLHIFFNFLGNKCNYVLLFRDAARLFSAEGTFNPVTMYRPNIYGENINIPEHNITSKNTAQSEKLEKNQTIK